MGMHSYIERVQSLSISRNSWHTPHVSAYYCKKSEYRTLSFTLLYLGHAVFSQDCYVALRLQPRLGKLTFINFIEGNKIFGVLTALRPRGDSLHHHVLSVQRSSWRKLQFLWSYWPYLWPTHRFSTPGRQIISSYSLE